jgi:putative endonuclease
MAASDGPDSSPRRAPRPERQAAFHLGISAESRAAAFLIAKGFRILARRWRSPVGEIDIVARRRRLLVFVEVKARATLEDAAESVNQRQRRRIAAAAEVWLAANPDMNISDCRFDAILVAPGKIPRHIPAAFEAG